MQLAPEHLHHCITCHQPNWGFNSDTNSGHAFGIFMPAIGTLQPIGFRCRLTRR
jgi:hypothetical protein